MLRRLAWTLPLSLAIACSGPSDTSHEHHNPGPGDRSSGPRAHFELGSGVPAILDVPFPSDAYVGSDGVLAIPSLARIVPTHGDLVSAMLSKQKGFSITAGVLFPIDGPRDAEGTTSGPAFVDADSLPATEADCLTGHASVLLVDLDASGPSSALVPCRVAYHDDRALGSSTPPTLVIAPARGVVLAEGHTHVAVVTTNVRAKGEPIGPSDTFAAIRDGKRRSTKLEKLYGDAVDRVVDLVPELAGKKAIAAITPFTTMDASKELVEMREQVAALPPPALDWSSASTAPMAAAVFGAVPNPSYTATLDAWLGTPRKLADGTDDPAIDQPDGYAHDALAVFGTAVMQAPNFLLDRPKGYADLDHANVARDAKGQPTINPDKPTAKVWISIALPNAPVPPAGFPVVIVQHGLGSDRSFLLALANTLAQHGWASVAIDAPTFGSRAVDPADVADTRANFRFSTAAGYAGPDGLVDADVQAFDLFGQFENFGAMRDQLREAAIDLGTVADVVTDPQLDLGPLLQAVPGAKFNPAHVGYIGDSFGSIIGLMTASTDPKISSFFLNVGGGGLLMEIGTNAPSIAELVAVGAIAFGYQSHDSLDWSHPFASVIQTILDPGDPLAHARRIVLDPPTIGGTKNRPKNVILTEVLWDELVANEAGEAVARVAGFPMASPNVGSNAGLALPVVDPVGGVIRDVPIAGTTAAIVQVSPATHGCDMYCANGQRSFAIPFGQPAPQRFVTLPTPIPIHEPYLGVQKMLVGFFDGDFSGTGAVVKDVPIPVRDFDDDGNPDATDPYPLDPTK